MLGKRHAARPPGESSGRAFGLIPGNLTLNQAARVVSLQTVSGRRRRGTQGGVRGGGTAHMAALPA